MNTIPFVIPADEFSSSGGGTATGGTPAMLRSLVDATRGMARPPISGFGVGAVGLGGSTGRVFRGVNLEFPGLPLHQSVHAEQFLVANMAQNGETSVRCLAVSAAPCGHCRQFLQELRGAPDIHILIAGSARNSCESEPLGRFLPHRFGPDDLLAQDLDFPLLLEPRNNRLALVEKSTDGLTGSTEGLTYYVNGLNTAFRIYPAMVAGDSASFQSSVLVKLRNAAFEAANKSYAPYTSCPSGVALLTRGSGVYAGFYCESAAYNPSLPPLQAAIVAFVANGGGGYEEFECAVLVERLGAKVQQAATVRMVLDQISPRCPLYVFYVH